jgi:D-alanyl-D-alanine dipeptidase
MRLPSILVCVGLGLAGPARAKAPQPDDFVDVAIVAPAVRRELRYATANNFTHQVVYPAARCLLRREVAEKIARVQAALGKQRLGLKLWDCYRPLSVQRRFWALVPDERYVADPAKGSRHNRGAAVDVTLVDDAGKELEMGSAFDDFSPRAHRDATGLTAAANAHRATLTAALAAEGFVGLPTEWWHFDAPDWPKFPLADVPLDGFDSHRP